MASRTETGVASTQPRNTAAIQTDAEVAVTRYRGQGYIVTYPSYWLREATDNAVSFQAPTQAGQIFFSIGPSARSLDEAFSSARANFPSVVFESPEPTVYGAWRGDTITGHFAANGQSGVITMTAIRANDIFYGLIMIAPAQVSWDAYKLREALANTLTFDHLPDESHGSGAPCSSCGGMLGATMRNLTSQTLSMMQ